jgi:uncharacterized protein YneF (UPF0154 family)
VELLIILIIVSLVITIIMGGTFLTCQRVQDYCALEAKREELMTRVRNCRLGRMLQSLNINIRDYVCKFPLAAITDHMSNCQKCDAATACDTYLADDRRDISTPREFCPNITEFDNLMDETSDNTACSHN